MDVEEKNEKQSRKLDNDEQLEEGQMEEGEMNY